MTEGRYAGFPERHRIFREGRWLDDVIPPSTPESREHDERTEVLVKVVRAEQRQQRRIDALKRVLERGRPDGAA